MLRKYPYFTFKNNPSENQRNVHADQPPPNYKLHNMQIGGSERIQNSTWTVAKCKFCPLVIAYLHFHSQPESLQSNQQHLYPDYADLTNAIPKTEQAKGKQQTKHTCNQDPSVRNSKTFRVALALFQNSYPSSHNRQLFPAGLHHLCS